MKPYIIIHLYPQTQTIASNIDYYNEHGEITKSTDTRYMVDHIYEILYPIYEEHGETHDIHPYSMGESIDPNQIEQDFYNFINGIMNEETK